MFATISIRAKIISVVAFLLVAMAGMGLLAVMKMRSMNANTIDITDTSVANDSFTFANYTGAPVVSVNGTGHVQVALSDGSTIVFTNLTDPNAVTGRLAP